MGRRRVILLDTHIFVALALGHDLHFIDDYRSEPLLVSAISAAEIACLVRLNRIKLSTAPDEWFTTAARRMRCKTIDLGAAVLARSMMFDWDHKDPADRILVQTLRDTPSLELHTRDAKIIDYANSWSLRCRDCRRL
jgi:PIN domain nuclease of toxin-antitoxin system